MDEPLGERVRTLGNEFGATTGRARRCGWFDASSCEYATRVNGLTDLAVTKLDVLDTLDRVASARATRSTASCTTSSRATSRRSTGRAALRVDRRMEALDRRLRASSTSCRAEARAYLDRLEELVEAPITYVSVGTRRDQIIGLLEPMITGHGRLRDDTSRSADRRRRAVRPRGGDLGAARGARVARARCRRGRRARSRSTRRT